MNLIDRAIVRAAQLAIGALHRRFDINSGKVWRVYVSTLRPGQPATPKIPSAPGVAAEVAGQVAICFGASDIEARRTPIVEVTMTQEMFDQFVASTNQVHEARKAQLAQLN